MSDNPLVTYAQAEDTKDLLNHIAWTDVIQPRLARLKANYGKMLVAHLLGQPLPGSLTKEQLAGRIYGIDEMERLFSRILESGQAAFTELEAQGIHVMDF